MSKYMTLQMTKDEFDSVSLSRECREGVVQVMAENTFDSLGILVSYVASAFYGLDKGEKIKIKIEIP